MYVCMIEWWPMQANKNVKQLIPNKSTAMMEL